MPRNELFEILGQPTNWDKESAELPTYYMFDDDNSTQYHFGPKDDDGLSAVYHWVGWRTGKEGERVG